MVGYGVCVINFSNSFQWINLKPCILVVDKLEDVHVNFCRRKKKEDKITAFSTSDNYEVSLQRRVASLYNQLLPGFASNQFETLHRCNKNNDDVHIVFSKQ